MVERHEIRNALKHESRHSGEHWAMCGASIKEATLSLRPPLRQAFAPPEASRRRYRKGATRRTTALAGSLHRAVTGSTPLPAPAARARRSTPREEGLSPECPAHRSQALPASARFWCAHRMNARTRGGPHAPGHRSHRVRPRSVSRGPMPPRHCSPSTPPRLCPIGALARARQNPEASSFVVDVAALVDAAATFAEVFANVFDTSALAPAFTVAMFVAVFEL